MPNSNAEKGYKIFSLFGKINLLSFDNNGTLSLSYQYSIRKFGASKICLPLTDMIYFSKLKRLI
jgi:hypothetical protein